MTRPSPWAGLALIACAAGLGLPWLIGDYYLTVALNLAMWIALTQSWTILSGISGYISLGHVVFFGIGAYCVVVTWQVLPLFAAIPLAGLVAGAFAALTGAPVLRVRGPYFVILTFGIAELVKYIVIHIEASSGQASRLLFGTPSVRELYLVMLALAVTATTLAWAVRRSRLGSGLVAIREDEEAAQSFGVPVTRFKVYAFVLAAVIPGMAGGTYVLRSTYFETVQVFDPVISFSIVTMAIIGGSDDARGPVLGAAFLVVMSEFLWSTLPQLYLIVLGLLLVVFVLFLPGGLVGMLGRYERAPAR